MEPYDTVGRIRIGPTPQWDAVRPGDRVGVNFMYLKSPVGRPYIQLPLGLKDDPIVLKKPLYNIEDGQLIEFHMIVESKDGDYITATFADKRFAVREFSVLATNITDIIEANE